MKNPLRKLHLAGIVGAVTTAVGIVSLPEVLNLLPAKVAAGVIAAGAVVQALTRAVNKGDVIEVKKSR